MLPSRSEILAEAINTKILTKNYPDSSHSHPDRFCVKKQNVQHLQYLFNCSNRKVEERHLRLLKVSFTYIDV